MNKIQAAAERRAYYTAKQFERASQYGINAAVAGAEYDRACAARDRLRGSKGRAA